MALYHVLLHFWLKFGTGEFAARSLSAIFAVLSIFPVYAIGARLFAPMTGIIAALLMTLNPFFIRYAQEARSYALYFFLAACASYFFLRARDYPTRKNWGLYIITGAFSVYAHLFAVWVLASHCISGAFFCRSAAQARKLILAHFLIGVLASPLLVSILAPDSYISHIGWLAKVSFGTLVEFFETLSGSGGAPPAVAYSLACGYALFCAWMRRSNDTSHIWSFVFLVNWLVLPVVASVLFSVAVEPIFLARYLISSLAPFVLIAAVGLENVRPAWLRAVAVLSLIVLTGRSVPALYGDGARKYREPWRATAEYVAGRSRLNDGIVFEQGYTRAPFEYYFREVYPQRKVPKPVWPADPWGKLDHTSFRGWPLIKAEEYPRLWRILLYEARELSKSRWRPENSETDYCLIQKQSFPAIHVILYQTCP